MGFVNSARIHWKRQKHASPKKKKKYTDVGRKEALSKRSFSEHLDIAKKKFQLHLAFGSGSHVLFMRPTSIFF